MKINMCDREIAIPNGITDAFYDFLSSDNKLLKYTLANYSVFPGFCDVHVHFREPGFSYKETISSGTMAAAHGGYTAVCTMPNLNPVPDSLQNLRKQTKLIDDNALIYVYPYGSITVGEKGSELVNIEALKNNVIAFSDDGNGIQSRDMMLAAMKAAKSADKIIAAHCEDNSLLCGGYIHNGIYAASHGHKGICSESEWSQIKRDIELVRESGCKYHVCHISTKESVELIRKAKKEGLDVSCETAPHYLVYEENDLMEDGRFKMNPPIRSAEDKRALICGLLDGTIDMIATDHAPHSAEEKAKGLAGSAFGIVGLETAFSVMYTNFVSTGIITIDKLLDLMVFKPRKRFNIPIGLDFSVWDLNCEYSVDKNDFLSMGKASPFIGERLFGKCLLTVCNGKVVYQA